MKHLIKDCLSRVAVGSIVDCSLELVDEHYMVGVELWFVRTSHDDYSIPAVKLTGSPRAGQVLPHLHLSLHQVLSR